MSLTDLSPGQIIAITFLGLVVIYLAVRLGSAAFFKSKQQYEKESNHAKPYQ